MLPLLLVPALLGAVVLGGTRISSSKPVAAAGELPMVPPIFHLNDGPTWFDTGVDVSGTHSLAVATPGTTVKFIVGPPDTLSDHDPDSVIWPTGAPGMPFHNDGGFIGEKSVTLTTPGLYAFQCTIHPYMLGAVLIVDPAAAADGTLVPDFGKMLSVRGVDKPRPSASDYIYRLVRVFFVITNSENWRRYHPDRAGSWMPRYAPSPIIVHDASGTPNLIPNLETFFLQPERQRSQHVHHQADLRGQRPDRHGDELDRRPRLLRRPDEQQHRLHLDGRPRLPRRRQADRHQNEVVKVLPCDPGCHGINWGAKQGGGYYGYVTSKFANLTTVVDSGGDNPASASVAGRYLTDTGPDTKTDVTQKKLQGLHGQDTTDGMGGQAVLGLPIVYNGWVQKLPDGLKAGLTCQQRDPMNPRACG